MGRLKGTHVHPYFGTVNGLVAARSPVFTLSNTPITSKVTGGHQWLLAAINGQPTKQRFKDTTSMLRNGWQGIWLEYGLNVFWYSTTEFTHFDARPRTRILAEDVRNTNIISVNDRVLGLVEEGAVLGANHELAETKNASDPPIGRDLPRSSKNQLLDSQDTSASQSLTGKTSNTASESQ
ncbi:hypothetical protein B0H19DRAFT_1067947 [Mycena capillaripes]|nr:hypothetical protein B0H19DRAFT_1067947 [Mycena capillaripes]